jgi:LmbE family N-acetylglucosaminyl deacetylase
MAGTGSPAPAQPTPLTGAAELAETLDSLNTLGSVLMLGAHPDDENTNVIAYFARGRHMRTAYLSATRGEGGQNLIGSEQAELMGVIRTQELLAARRIDGGEQFFTRAIDFGFSKSSDETLEKWGRERVLGDMVRIIRHFRPDVLISRFGPDDSGGHGHHNAVGHLAPEAFAAAGDAARFPEQLQEGLKPWKPKRLYWNTFSFTRRMEQDEAQRADRLRLDTGEYDPLLGKSYAEVAGESRSMHRSQGMGAPERKGPAPAFFAYLAGEHAQSDLFDGIETSWSRVLGGAAVGELLEQARREYRPEKPSAIAPLLAKAYAAMTKLDDPWVAVKQAEVLHAIELATGLWVDATAERWDATRGSPLVVELSAVNRSDFALSWRRTEISGLVPQTVEQGSGTLAYNVVSEKNVTLSIPNDAPYSQPYWLRQDPEGAFYSVSKHEWIGRAESPELLTAMFSLATPEGIELPIRKPVAFRWVDPAAGEETRSVHVVPSLAVEFSQSSLIFPEAKARNVSVKLQAYAPSAKGMVSLEAPPGWSVRPVKAPFDLGRKGQQLTLQFEVAPPSNMASGEARAKVELAGETVSSGVRVIGYPHIPIQTVYPEARLRLERTDLTLLSKRIGYVMGAGDTVPQALEQIGATVQLLSPDDLISSDLSRFDTIVTGIRVADTRPDLPAAKERLLDYVNQGGTLVVQYNTAGGRSAPATLAPYPLEPSRDRVSVEDAPVTFVNPAHALLNQPNRITPRDFEGWVQERGLYFMGEWDQRYETMIESHDPGEPPGQGGMLYARYGKGVYIFTAYSWFRQLPAGVPGAHRIFANLVSAGKVGR